MLLPSWIFEQAQGDKDEIKRLVRDYMRRYPNYQIIKVSGSFAICERFDGFL
ncbi:MAG: hypothetical protein RR595_13815 [Lysinibacillus sp.]